jgi:crotonobetainyl-CoA:carnitine CoA-transferase CaiB-like acyl-CoA transferase
VHGLVDARNGRQIGTTGGLPVTFSAGQMADQPARVTGEDTAAVLAEVLRLSVAEIEQLRERGVI